MIILSNIYGCSSLNTGNTYTATSDVDNLDLQEPSDETPPLYQNVGSNATTINVGESILLYSQGYDAVGLDWAWLATNESGSWHNYTSGLGWN